ncbi:LPXTG cell wall anchor domain-containing protein, partial [Lactococcus cremoris]|nr:LPXTG cell wall anchor domain-containing protein [Lactococcus cremoris]
ASDTKSAAQSAATAVSSASDTKSAAQSAATVASSASDTKSADQSTATAASRVRNRRSAPSNDATSQTNLDGKTQYSSLNNSQILSFELNSQDSNAPTATGVNLTATYTQANLPKQFKNDGMTGDTFWLYSGADLLNSNVSITKHWANAGSINGRNVDFHEKFHDFVAQNNPGTYGISSIKGVDTKKPYLILISSNAVDNIDVYNANFQETFWFTYSNDDSIVDITKFNQANAAQNNNQIFYFLSASLSSNNGPYTNRREYVQTNDAKTVVISQNPINDPSTGFIAPKSTIGLTRVSGSNVPDGLVYTNTDTSGYQSHDGEDSNPDYYALQGGVTFANFTSNKPTLYLGAVPINALNTNWWHGNHNKNSDFLSFVTYSIFNNKKVNETINYVDQTGKTVAPSHTANPITFITVKAWDGTTTYYKFGSQENPTLDKAGKPDSSWIQADNAKFGAIDNPKVNGYKVISTTAPGSDLNSVAIQTVKNTSDDLNFTVTYTLNQEAANVTYIDDKTGKTLSAKDLTGDYGSTDPYRTGDTIADYEKQGYQLVSDNYPTHGVVYNQDGTVQKFEFHLTHGTTPVGPKNPQTPGTPINPDNPDGPKWPEGTDKSSVTQTVIRTVNYLDKQTGKVVAKQVTEQVTYNRTAIVDKVTGQIIGYSTTGGDTVDQTDGDKAWTAVDNKSDWDSVTSPDLSSKGYLAPDLATVAQQTVTPGDKDVTVNVYYDHDVVPVNPTNPQTPGEPINPDNPDGPKWPEGTDKSSVTQTVIRTVNSPELPQTGENNSQSQTMSFIGILLAMFGSLFGFLGIKKRRND